MKITTDNYWLYYKPENIKVFINDKQIHGSVEADIEAGYIIEWATDENNKLLLNEKEETYLRRVEGVVHIKGKRDAPLDPAKWYITSEKKKGLK